MTLVKTSICLKITKNKRIKEGIKINLFINNLQNLINKNKRFF